MEFIIACTLFFFLWVGLRDPVECSLLGGGIPAQNRGYKGTRLCLFIVLSCYLVLPACIPGPSSLPVTLPPPLFAPTFLLTPTMISHSPPPSPILPANTTMITPMPLEPEQNVHRGPELATLQYTA